jgi:hypothetical protein
VAALDSKLDINIIHRRATLLARSGSPVVAKALITEYLAFRAQENTKLGASCRSPEAARLLVELADSAEIKQYCFYELVTALAANVNPDARHGLITLLDQACSGALPRGCDTAPLTKSIANKAKSDDTMWANIKSRCSKATSAVERGILSQILYEIGSADAALTLCELIHDEFPINYHMVKLIENTATSSIPAGGNAYYLAPRAATALKKRLFGVAMNDITRRKSALERVLKMANCQS